MLNVSTGRYSLVGTAILFIVVCYTNVIYGMLDCVHMASIAHMMYWYMVTNFTNPSALNNIPWSLPTVILLTITSDTVVRSFFTYRVWIVSGRNRTLCAILTFLLMIVYVSGLIITIMGYRVSTWEQAAKFIWTMYIEMFLVMFTDAMIAGTLCYYLRRSRSTISDRTNYLLNVLIQYTINTGVATSAVMLVCMIIYVTMPQNFVYIGVYFTLSKFYLNALLTTLNAREKNRRDVSLDNNTTIIFKHTTGQHEGSVARHSTIPGAAVRVHVGVEEESFKL
ncbi:hypothetical protein C8Q74DRAFT_668270 [Fomes fomentarius]|nr:hypothetical protein C8Q74DRAFT_668270 [Fomes fomentarius]